MENAEEDLKWSLNAVHTAMSLERLALLMNVFQEDKAANAKYTLSAGFNDVRKAWADRIVELGGNPKSPPAMVESDEELDGWNPHERQDQAAVAGESLTKADRSALLRIRDDARAMSNSLEEESKTSPEARRRRIALSQLAAIAEWQFPEIRLDGTAAVTALDNDGMLVDMRMRFTGRSPPSVSTLRRQFQGLSTGTTKTTTTADEDKGLFE